MNEEIQAIQMTLEEAEAKVKRADDADKLLKNKIFKELITELYLGTDASRLAMQLGKSGDSDIRIHAMLRSKADFSRFIGNILNEGDMAQESINEHKELLADIDKGE
jgi:hypothetical protein